MIPMKERMHTGALYLPNDPAIVEEQTHCLERLYDFNHTRPARGEERQTLLRSMLAELGEGCYIEPPFYANWGGRNCWIGAGAVILPGITVGDNTVIGAGSVVTKDLPANVVAVGNPCRVLRPISDRDREYYFKNRPINWDEIPE